MTDREHFAAAALAGLIGWKRGDDTPSSITDLARRAYGLADAMLRESDRTYEKSDEKRCDSGTGGVTLTKAERAAVEVACQDLRHKEEVATLRGLLTRLS